MNLPDRCNFCLRVTAEHLMGVNCERPNQGTHVGPSGEASVFGLAFSILEERNAVKDKVRDLTAENDLLKDDQGHLFDLFSDGDRKCPDVKFAERMWHLMVARKTELNSELLKVEQELSDGKKLITQYRNRLIEIGAEKDKLEVEGKKLKSTLDPILAWYDGDGRVTDYAVIIEGVVADLQRDRKELLKLSAEIGKLHAEKGRTKWYDAQEIREWLIRKNYSEEIAEEISVLFAEHFQHSFDKGFEKANPELVRLRADISRLEIEKTFFESRLRAADALVKEIDNQAKELGQPDPVPAIANARLKYGQPFVYTAKEHVRMAALEEELKDRNDFIEYVRDAPHAAQTLRDAAKKILQGDDW